MPSIEGKTIRQMLRSKRLPYGEEIVCCGGKVRFNKDYKKQLQLLGMKGDYTVKENGIITAFVKVD